MKKLLTILSLAAVLGACRSTADVSDTSSEAAAGECSYAAEAADCSGCTEMPDCAEMPECTSDQAAEVCPVSGESIE